MIRTSTRIVAIAADARLRSGFRARKPACGRRPRAGRQQHGREPEEEHDLPDRAGMPADDGYGRAVPSPVYQPVSADNARSRPKRKVRRPPRPAPSRHPERRRPRQTRTCIGEAYDAAPTDALHGRVRVPRIPLWHNRPPTTTPSPPGRDPPLDPDAISRNYRLHRARREAKAKRHREKRWAGVRFWLVLALVVARRGVLAARTLGEIERVFGL